MHPWFFPEEVILSPTPPRVTDFLDDKLVLEYDRIPTYQDTSYHGRGEHTFFKEKTSEHWNQAWRWRTDRCWPVASGFQNQIFAWNPMAQSMNSTSSRFCPQHLPEQGDRRVDRRDPANIVSRWVRAGDAGGE